MRVKEGETPEIGIYQIKDLVRGISTSYIPNCPRTGKGHDRGRILANIQAYLPLSDGQHAPDSSRSVIILQSTTSTMARAYPASSMRGDRDETINIGPRYFVGRERISTVLSPRAMRFAQGCLTESAFMPQSLLDGLFLFSVGRAGV